MKKIFWMVVAACLATTPVFANGGPGHEIGNGHDDGGEVSGSPTATATAVSFNDIDVGATAIAASSLYSQVGVFTSIKNGQGQSMNGGNIAPVQSVSLSYQESREFAPLPSPPVAPLVEHRGEERALYSSEDSGITTNPWRHKVTWTQDDVDRLPTCWYRCKTEVVPYAAAKNRIGRFDVGVGSPVEKIQGEGTRPIAIIYASATSPGTLWGNVATEAMNYGATVVVPVKTIPDFRTDSKGLSLNLGGGVTTMSNSQGTGSSATSGVGGGWSEGGYREGQRAAFLLY